MGRVYHYVLGDDDAPTTANTTQFWQMFGMATKHNTEANTQMMMRTDGTISNLHVRVDLNTINDVCTIRVRKNGTDTSLAVTVPASSTGNYKDDSNTVTVTAGDKICLTTVPGSGSTGVIGLGFYRTVFASSDASKTVTRLAVTSNIYSQNGAQFGFASTTNYFALNGVLTGTISAEAGAKCRQRRTGTFRNLIVKVRSNSRATDTIISLRKNGSSATNTITVSAGATGWLEDTTHTDTIAVGDDFNYSLVTGTGGGAIIIEYIGVEYVSPDGYGQLVAGSQSSSTTHAHSTNADFAIAGDRFGLSGLNTFQDRVPQDVELTFSDLTILVGSNNTDNDSTFTFRKNNANGNQTVTIPANTTGVFSDMAGNTDSPSVDDVINYRLSVGTGASGDVIQVDVVSCWTFDGVAAPSTAIKAECDAAGMDVAGEYYLDFTTADDVQRQTVWFTLSA